VRDPLTHPTVVGLAQKYGKTPAQVVHRWHIQHGVSAISKSFTPAHINENFDIFDFALSVEDIAAIDAMDRGVRGGPIPSGSTRIRSLSRSKTRDRIKGAMSGSGTELPNTSGALKVCYNAPSRPTA
jgi:diketogulonate reductase-like aldo/keto reductase